MDVVDPLHVRTNRMMIRTRTAIGPPVAPVRIDVSPLMMIL
jgi:hypothetical protein